MIVFALIAVLTLAGSIAALTLRNLVHCALALALALSGLAALYLNLGAQFAGFAQVLIYVGAVAILIVFAILLTRGTDPSTEPSQSAAAQAAVHRFRLPTWVWGLATAAGVFAVLASVILGSTALKSPAGPPATATVRQIGEELMTRYVLPLEVLGLLLTAALIGAVIIALREREPLTSPK